MRSSAAGTLLLLIGLLGLPAPTCAQTAENRVSLDLQIFDQRDKTNDTLRNQGFTYGSGSIAMRYRVNDVVVVRSNTTLAYIAPGKQPKLPQTIDNASVTSASPDTITWDIALTVDIRKPGSRWTWSPGVYYHHQFGWAVPGLNLGVKGEFFNGDGILKIDYLVRAAIRPGRYWDGTLRGTTYLLSNNLLLSWTQTLSPSWIASAGLQYVRQDGLLVGYHNFVTLYDRQGTPIRLIDEKLPRQRNRVQLNLRARYSPKLGFSLGLDTSGYIDDWRVRHGSVQASIEIPMERWLRFRAWYRFAAQQRTRHFAERPLAAGGFQTQDADLDSFLMHNAGITLRFSLLKTRRPHWTLRFAVIGFYRSDGMAAVGGSAGVVASW